MSLLASTKTQLSNENAVPSNTFVREDHFGDSIVDVSFRHHSPNEGAMKYNQSLSIARNIEDLHLVTYPEGVLPPKAELNTNTEVGRFRYDLKFLLQFKEICKEKPDTPAYLDGICVGTRRHSLSNRSGIPTEQLSKAIAAVKNNRNLRTSSVDVFHHQVMVDNPASTASISYATSQPVRSSRAQTALVPSSKTCFRSNQSLSTNSPVSRLNDPLNIALCSGSNFDVPSGNPPLSYAQLTLSANRWVPNTGFAEDSADPNSPEIVDRKVKGLLNKLTDQNFDGVSDQIILWTNKSELDRDATLGKVTRLIVEHATEDEARSEIYARLCQKASEKTSTVVRDEASMELQGNPITGGRLFRKYLLNWCHKNFECFCTTEIEGRSSAAIALFSDEYYATQKTKRRGLGFIRFLGELFKLKMLTERIIHECVQRFVDDLQHPGEAQMEYLCKLLATTGSTMDLAKARAHMDVYFARMKVLTLSRSLAPRIRFMLQDVIELRDRKWVPRHTKAMAQMDEAIAAQKRFFYYPDASVSSNLGKAGVGSRSIPNIFNLLEEPAPSVSPIDIGRPASSLRPIANWPIFKSSSSPPKSKAIIVSPDGEEVLTHNRLQQPSRLAGVGNRRPLSTRMESEQDKKLRIQVEEVKAGKERDEKARKKSEVIDRLHREAEERPCPSTLPSPPTRMENEQDRKLRIQVEEVKARKERDEKARKKSEMIDRSHKDASPSTGSTTSSC